MPVAITLGAIAAATAPAATLMVVRQYKAKGPVTDVLLPVVALDDAVGLVIFAISFGVAQSLENGTTNIAALILEPLMEVILSLTFGGLVGLALTWLERFFHSHRNRNALIVGSVILTVAVSQLKIPVGIFTFGFSSLLVCMMLGTVFCNFCPLSEDLMLHADRWSSPVITLFFVLSGAGLDFSVLTTVVLVGVIYVIARVAGKVLGATLGAVVEKCDRNIIRYLGLTLIPQAGVAIGMARLAMQDLPEYGAIINAVVLAGTLVYELTGPVITKTALLKAGEITPENAGAGKKTA